VADSQYGGGVGRFRLTRKEADGQRCADSTQPEIIYPSDNTREFFRHAVESHLRGCGCEVADDEFRQS
jgi:hypothetical protein